MSFFQNRFAVETFRLARNTNSLGFPKESIVLERFLHAVPTFTYVASRRNKMPLIVRI